MGGSSISRDMERGEVQTTRRLYICPEGMTMCVCARVEFRLKPCMRQIWTDATEDASEPASLKPRSLAR